MRRFDLLSTAPHELPGEGVVWPDGSVSVWTREHGVSSSRGGAAKQYQSADNHRIRFIDPPEGEPAKGGLTRVDIAQTFLYALAGRLKNEGAPADSFRADARNLIHFLTRAEEPKAEDKLPSDWVRDWVATNTAPPFRESGEIAIATVRGVLAYLDEQHRERLGRR